MATILIALQSANIASNSTQTWNSFLASANNAALSDSLGATTQILFSGTPGGNGATGNSGSGSGDAAWVDQTHIMDQYWGTLSGGTSNVKFSGFSPNAAITSIKTFSYRAVNRPTSITINGGAEQVVSSNDRSESTLFADVNADANGEVLIVYTGIEAFGYLNAVEIVADMVVADYTARKGSTATITHTLTAAGLTSATLNGQAVTIASQSGQTASINFTDTITTSDVYDLVLGDDVGTQTFTVQYNVIGLTTNTIQKEGTSIGARSDLEMDVLDATGATVLGTLTGLTTDASGITGQTIVPAGSVGDPVRVSGYSEAAGIGFAYKTTLGLL